MNASLPPRTSGARAGFTSLAPLAILLGSAALAARPALLFASAVVSVLVGGIGALIPLPERQSPAHRLGAAGRAGVVAIGVAAFALGRLVAAPLPQPTTLLGGVATIGAACAEELFFRRLVYGFLAQWGDALAVTGAALVFAAVHIPAYGVPAFPVDLAAGLLLGWQRWATGGWGAPAVTHAAANVLQLL